MNTCATFTYPEADRSIAGVTIKHAMQRSCHIGASSKVVRFIESLVIPHAETFPVQDEGQGNLLTANKYSRLLPRIPDNSR